LKGGGVKYTLGYCVVHGAVTCAMTLDDEKKEEEEEEE